jgi:hypothetical protein
MQQSTGHSAAARVGVDPDRSDPPQSFAPSAIPDHKPDKLSILDRLERYRLRESQGGQDIDPGPGIGSKTVPLQLKNLPEIPPTGRPDDGLVRRRCHLWGLPLLGALAEVLQQAGEFHGHDELSRRALTHDLQRLEVLQGHGLLIDRLGHREDLIQRSRKAFCP